MADPNLVYDPVEGWESETVFVKNPVSEAATRTLFQRLFTQIQTFINSTLITWINATFATKTDLSGAVLSGISDDSMTNAKLATDVKIGSNATLATTHKTTIVGAINEIVSNFLTTTAYNASFDADIGSIKYFAMQTAPTRYLEANGAAVSRTTYSKLFAAIGTTYGVGDNSTTFNLPDLRGVFPRGWDNGRGYDAGRTFGSYQADDNKAHTHTGTTAANGEHSHTYSSATNNRDATGGSSAASATSTTTSTEAAHTHTFTTESSGGATETRVKNTALLVAIKY